MHLGVRRALNDEGYVHVQVPLRCLLMRGAGAGRRNAVRGARGGCVHSPACRRRTRVETAGGAHGQIMEQRIRRRLALSLALPQIVRCLEMRAGIAALMATDLQIMRERIEVEIRNIGVGVDIESGVEEARSGKQVVLLKQDRGRTVRARVLGSRPRLLGPACISSAHDLHAYPCINVRPQPAGTLTLENCASPGTGPLHPWRDLRRYWSIGSIT